MTSFIQRSGCVSHVWSKLLNKYIIGSALNGQLHIRENLGKFFCNFVFVLNKGLTPKLLENWYLAYVQAIFLLGFVSWGGQHYQVTGNEFVIRRVYNFKHFSHISTFYCYVCFQKLNRYL